MIWYTYKKIKRKFYYRRLELKKTLFLPIYYAKTALYSFLWEKIFYTICNSIYRLPVNPFSCKVRFDRNFILNATHLFPHNSLRTTQSISRKGIFLPRILQYFGTVPWNRHQAEMQSFFREVSSIACFNSSDGNIKANLKAKRAVKSQTVIVLT